MQNRYPRGALMAEAPVTEGSAIYGPVIKEIDEKAWKKYAIAEARHRDLVGNLSRVQYSKYDPLKDGDAAGPFSCEDKFFQTKSRVEGRDSFRRCNTTYDSTEINKTRTLDIRNMQTKGRKYDIISGAGYKYLEPTVPESMDSEHARRMHPSLNHH